MDLQKTQYSHGRWTQEQQNFIRYLYEKQKVQGWKKISILINQRFNCSSRNPKQCRDRYINHIKYTSPNVEQLQWSEMQTRKLFQKYNQFGSKWTLISSQFGSRSQNTLKNKFYNSLRKFLRRLNKLIKENRSQKRKPIKYQSLIKVLQFSKTFSHLQGKKHMKIRENEQKYCQLRTNMIWELYNSQNHTESEQNLQKIIEQIFQFCKETKFVCQNKKLITNCKEQPAKALDTSLIDPIILQTDKQLSVVGQYVGSPQIFDQFQDDMNFQGTEPTKDQKLNFFRGSNSQLLCIDQYNVVKQHSYSDIWESQLNQNFSDRNYSFKFGSIS